MRTGLILLLTLLFAYSAQAGKLYKWVDEEGKTHYSQTPPPAAETEERDIPDAKEKQADKTVKKTKTEPQAEDESEEVAEEDAPQTEMEKLAAQKKENCAQADKELSILKASEDLVKRDEEGKLAVVSKAEREQRMKKAEAYIQTYCQTSTSEEETSE